MKKFTCGDIVLGLASLGFAIYLVYTKNLVLLFALTLIHFRIDRLIHRIEDKK